MNEKDFEEVLHRIEADRRSLNSEWLEKAAEPLPTEKQPCDCDPHDPVRFPGEPCDVCGTGEPPTKVLTRAAFANALRRIWREPSEHGFSAKRAPLLLHDAALRTELQAYRQISLRVKPHFYDETALHSVEAQAEIAAILRGLAKLCWIADRQAGKPTDRPD